MIPYLKKRYKNITIKMYDMDDKKTTDHYNQAIDSLKDFDDEYYGLGPFIYVKGYFALLDMKQMMKKYSQKILNVSQWKETYSRF